MQRFDTKMTKKALVLAANGTEESELVITIEVTIAGLNGTEPITCSRNVKIVPDVSLESVQNNLYDAVILPGGLGGTEEFCKSELAAKIVKRHDSELKLICCICAAPLAITKYGIGMFKNLTSHPCVQQTLLMDSSYTYKEDRVVIDENLITSRGPGTAFEFALTICEVLVGKEKTATVRSPLMTAINDNTTHQRYVDMKRACDNPPNY